MLSPNYQLRHSSFSLACFYMCCLVGLRVLINSRTFWWDVLATSPCRGAGFPSGVSYQRYLFHPGDLQSLIGAPTADWGCFVSSLSKIWGLQVPAAQISVSCFNTQLKVQKRIDKFINRITCPWIPSISHFWHICLSLVSDFIFGSCHLVDTYLLLFEENLISGLLTFYYFPWCLSQKWLAHLGYKVVAWSVLLLVFCCCCCFPTDPFARLFKN